MRTRQNAGPLELLDITHPATLIVGSALLVILGVLIILFPPLLRWVIGIGLILAGVGVFATVVAPTR